MITFKFFRALNNSPDHNPLFQYIIHRPTVPLPWYVWLIGLLFFGIFMLPIVLIVYFTFSATVFGLRWLFDITGGISTIVKQRRYELLCLTPHGEFGIHWLIVIAYLHRMGSYQRLNSRGFWVIRGGIVLAIYFYITSQLPEAYIYDGFVMLKGAVISAILIGFFVHHYQSITFCVLAALLIPTYRIERLTDSMSAMAMLIGAQFVSYSLFLLIDSVALSPLSHALSLSFESEAIVSIVLHLLTFIAIREVMIYGLWRMVLRRYDVSQTDAVHLLDGVNRKLV